MNKIYIYKTQFNEKITSCNNTFSRCENATRRPHVTTFWCSSLKLKQENKAVKEVNQASARK